MLYIFRWLQGFVRFKVIGKFPERFINIVTRSNFTIWDTNTEQGTLGACMYVRDYKCIRLFARKSRVRLKVVKKSGFPFFLKKYKPRIGVLIGVLVFSLIVFFMSEFVWTIDIVGLETISKAKVLSVLEDNGLYVGMYKRNASFKTIERDTMLDLDDIGWMSVNVINSHASVEIKEKAKSPKVDDYKTPANVKAKRDGLIISMKTSEGKSYFESGSAVVKDQLLVSAVVEDQLGGVKLVRANSEIIAETSRTKTFSVIKNNKVIEFSEPVARKELQVFSLKLPFSFNFADESNSIINYKTESVVFFDTVLPLSVTTKSIYETENCKKHYSEKDAKLRLEKQCSLYEAFELSKCKIKDRKFDFFETDTHYCLTVLYSCEEDIAYQQEINIDNADLTQIEVKKDEK
ncbi:MAG: sporulation protein YqfD [Ruminococcus sp.]|nr:sporulation protein YqfD [Ruminococcus sp.]